MTGDRMTQARQQAGRCHPPPTGFPGQRPAHPGVLPALVAMAILAATPAQAERTVITGQAQVIDADTLDINGTRIRLWGIDAPERDQTCTLGKLIYNCGELAADELATFLKEQTVHCQRKATDPVAAGKPAGDAGTDRNAGTAVPAGTDPSAGTDRYGRIVAVCHASAGQAAGDGQDIAAWLVENGMAFDWPRYSGGNYRLWQDAARTRRAGLWQGKFEFPWLWRKP